MIAFGGGEQTASERELLGALGISHLVSFTGGDDGALAAHYAAATALVYPSLDEGFGLPPLEAMGHGCPVAASAAGAIPEVTGDAALLFDPADTDAIADAIDRITFDESFRARAQSSGRKRAASFSWDETARKTLSAYATALEAAAGRRS
jgi:glycosyltransferase involved in cell wall biosynthesis